MYDVQMHNVFSQAGLQALTGSRPIAVNRDGRPISWNKMNGRAVPQIETPRGLRVNSLLRKDEWEELDSAIVQASTQRLNGIMHLRAAGLTFRLGGIGSVIAQYNQASDITEAAVTIDGHSRGSRDRVDFNLVSVPVPVIHKEYDFGARELEGARNMGNAIETSHAESAARVVAEKQESILFGGAGDFQVNGNPVYGYTNHPDRNTDTANGYGGGDWGTAANVKSTILGMISALSADGFYGPYHVYAANTQYFEALASFAEKPGSPLTEVMDLPQIEGFDPSDELSAGEVVVVQMTRNVVDYAFVPGFELSNLEWMSDDGMKAFFKVLTIAIPRVKSEYSGKSGVAHATGT